MYRELFDGPVPYVVFTLFSSNLNPIPTASIPLDYLRIHLCRPFYYYIASVRFAGWKMIIFSLTRKALESDHGLWLTASFHP